MPIEYGSIFSQGEDMMTTEEMKEKAMALMTRKKFH
jgi:hypothetical protein